jgi:hypothetical protein
VKSKTALSKAAPTFKPDGAAMLVRNVMVDFRVEEDNPFGEANRVILGFSCRIHKPKGKKNPRTNRLFRRYYVYDDQFGPHELDAVLVDLRHDLRVAVNEMGGAGAKSPRPRLSEGEIRSAVAALDGKTLSEVRQLKAP